MAGMKVVRCDQCRTEVHETEPPVYLHGVSSVKGGLLLPDRFHNHDFCSPKCFWRWTAVQLAVMVGHDNPLEKP